jgi:glycosyltransferase involved in cell wall biosynthesis
MKIEIIHPRHTQNIGGAEKVLIQTIEALQEEFEIEVKVFASLSPLLREEVDVEITEIKENIVSEKLVQIGRLTILGEGLENRSAIKSINENKLTVLTGGIFGNCSLSNCIQYVHTPKTQVEQRKEGSLIREVYYKMTEYIKPHSLVETDGILFNSGFTKQSWKKEGEVIYPPVESNINNLGLEEKEDYGIAVGRYSPEKNFEEAIEIFDKLDLKLIIAGLIDNKNYLKEIEKLAEGKEVKIMKNLPQDDLSNLIEKAKIGVLSMRNEHFGISVVEYMKGGALPMVRNEGGPKEIVPGEEFTYDSTQEARKKISNNLENFENLQKEVVDKSKNFSDKNFRENMKSIVKVMKE